MIIKQLTNLNRFNCTLHCFTLWILELVTGFQYVGWDVHVGPVILYGWDVVVGTYLKQDCCLQW